MGFSSVSIKGVKTQAYATRNLEGLQVYMEEDSTLTLILVLGVVFAVLLGLYIAYSVYDKKDELKYEFCIREHPAHLCERFKPNTP